MHTYKFYAFTIKIDSIKRWERREFKWGNAEKFAQHVHFAIFYKNATVFKEKRKITFKFQYRIRNVNNFLEFIIENIFEAMSESSKFRFETSLNYF